MLIFFVSQAPIQVFGIEGRYAHAIYSAAAKNNKLDAVDKDVQKLKVIPLYNYLKSGEIP